MVKFGDCVVKRIIRNLFFLQNHTVAKPFEGAGV